MNNPSESVRSLNGSQRSPNESLRRVSLDANRYRPDFPILDRVTSSGAPLAFLDNAASSQRPNAVIDAMTQCYRQYYANVHRGIHTLSEESTDRYEQARRGIAKFVGAAETHEVIFAAGTTAAINTVARSWGDANLSTGDTILLTIAEHHANIVPWHQLAERTGCKVEFLPLDENFTITDDVVVDALERFQPKLFAFTASSNTLGVEFPVQRWTSLAHQAGCTVLVDAAQAAPHQAIDVQALDVDFLVFSGHKVCGPTGIGVLYGKAALLDAMPPFLSGGGMINEVTTSGFSCAALPDKFEAGTPPIAEAIGLHAATEYLTSVGLDAIHAYEKELGGYADQALREIDGVRIIGPTPELKAGIVSFVVDGVHAHDMSQTLDTYGIAVRAGHHCTMPLHKSLGLSATTRASFYFYNTFEEADRLIQAVREIRTRFAPSGRKRRRRS
ncbi:putative cysteine desulfurase [Novipirellula galeiformis]|uniref:Cysteine desulfurase n=1 Tax=Novipirellula galeiformis TaxID=2528004 RepID=A0A5C6CHR3_9BACT|nr:SufS family cysteine desulfurase [Novipirellula galeiformis]TWU23918.1 putative cysteine desulfurase [Novipirellula galeiformis]